MDQVTTLLQTARARLRGGTHNGAERDSEPVRALALSLSCRLETGDLAVDTLFEAARQLCDERLTARARRLSDYAQPHDLDALLDRLAGDDPARLKALIAKPRAGIVFTAHPTFALAREMRARLANAVQKLIDDPDAPASLTGRHGPDDALTVLHEHEDIQDAVERLKNALYDAHACVCRVLRRVDPMGWRAVTPRLISVASWVGYDLDGRTDIHWSATIQIRLDEKARQLRRYQRLAQDIVTRWPAIAAAPLTAFAELAANAASHAEDAARLFGEAQSDVARVANASNMLTRADPRRLVSAEPLRVLLDEALESAADDACAQAIWLLRAEVAGFGLGTAEIHLRVNSAQVRNAARADFDIDPEAGGFGRVALDRAAELAAQVPVEAVNFASVFLEKATARRQMMLAAQIRKHIDADAPIRFLIAELESPVTILAAVFLARRYGVADAVDISPLFETPRGLEGGGRLIAQLLDEPAYLDYVRQRGRLSVQIGFSDAGRYMGQLPTSFAAERLQILIARALARRDIRDLEVVIFNTHGESMGRGAHPRDMPARLAHLLTPWTAARFAHERIALVHETSFQGGDGLMHFATAALAQRSLESILATRLSLGAPVANDRFYADLDFSWDFYRALKSWQEALSVDPDHGAVLAGLGPNMLLKTGSRPVKRASAGAKASPSPRLLRAIPHNAILQQLGAPANVACGIGRPVELDPDRCVDWAKGSPRARNALEMAAAARGLTSIAVLRAYAGLFDASFWTARAYGGGEPQLRAPAGLIAQRLQKQHRFTAYTRLANQFARDVAQFDDIAARLDTIKAAQDAQAPARADIEVLQAFRLALLMRLFLLAARLPTFSDRFDITRDDLLDLVLDLRIEEAVALLDQIFPAGGDGAALIDAIEEPGAPRTEALRGYPEIQRDIVAPMLTLITAIREIGVGISHAYNAYG